MTTTTDTQQLPPIQRLTLRIYGMLVQDQCMLLTDELLYGQHITKLPGGGLQLGESTHQALQREFVEECNCAVDVLHHVYTTDFFIRSAFAPATQVLCIYYQVAPHSARDKAALDALPATNTMQFRWVPIQQLAPHMLSLESDQRALSEWIEQQQHFS